MYLLRSGYVNLKCQNILNNTKGINKNNLTNVVIHK